METFSALLALCAGNSPVNSPRKGQWRGALMFSLICATINACVNNREAGDFRRHRGHYDVIVMLWYFVFNTFSRVGQCTGLLLYPRFNEVGPSVRPSVRPSVCMSMDEIVSALYLTQYLLDPISYLHISSSNLRRCVSCKAFCKISKSEVLAIF